MIKVQRSFYPGDKWLYYKIYTGTKTADDILLDYLYPGIKKLLKEKIISKWFFIRYSDPDFHIRCRVLMNDTTDIGYVMNTFHNKLKKAYKDSLIDRTEIDTYNRELERYGENTMEISESIFYFDSECIINLLSVLRKKDENLRWMVGLKLINSLFDDIGFDLEKRAKYMEGMSNSYKNEFGYNMYNAKQLNNIYRDRKKMVDQALKDVPENEQLLKANTLLNKCSGKIKKELKQINVPDNNISSYIHMSMNRLFRSKNRVHELLIYDFMLRYYKSEIAKLGKNK